MARLGQAFYAEGRDTTSAEEIADVAEEAGFDRGEFSAAFLSADTRNETFRDFLTAQEMGIRGFPTLIAGSEDKGYALAHQRLPAARGHPRSAGALVGRRRPGDGRRPIGTATGRGMFMTTELEAYSVVAYNTARDSENKIHDNTVARRFGFSGGLVPGVDVYAYMAHLPVARWGRDFLRTAASRPAS